MTQKQHNPKKLVLSKKTISILNGHAAQQFVGGGTAGCQQTYNCCTLQATGCATPPDPGFTPQSRCAGYVTANCCTVVPPLTTTD